MFLYFSEISSIFVSKFMYPLSINWKIQSEVMGLVIEAIRNNVL